MAVVLTLCSKDEAKSRAGINKIRTYEQFEQILDGSKDSLLVIDFYADWCAPCKMLDPIMKEIAQEYNDRAKFYKVNIDYNRKLAAEFGASSIPLIVFVKNKEAVHGLMGVQPYRAYAEAIVKYGHT
ncbi:MAG: thioredoxin [Chitinivibrionales bacterium]|nr:thioredoxin [Chitinivibrionales bacterium]